MMQGTEQLNNNVLKINEMNPDMDLSWQYEGMDTEPYIYLYIGDTAKIRGTLHDITAMTDEMLKAMTSV